MISWRLSLSLLETGEPEDAAGVAAVRGGASDHPHRPERLAESRLTRELDALRVDRGDGERARTVGGGEHRVQKGIRVLPARWRADERADLAGVPPGVAERVGGDVPPVVDDEGGRGKLLQKAIQEFRSVCAEVRSVELCHPRQIVCPGEAHPGRHPSLAAARVPVVLELLPE